MKAIKTYKTYAAAAALAVAVVLILAACGGGNDSGGPSAMPSTPSSAQDVSVSDVNGVGKILVDAQGKALYASDQEAAGGKVLCTSSCTAFWDPLTLAKGAGRPTGDSSVASKLGTIARPDGTRQITFDGKPLYSFSEDTGPGVVSGNGIADSFDGQDFTWHVETPTGMSGVTTNPTPPSGIYGP